MESEQTRIARAKEVGGRNLDQRPTSKSLFLSVSLVFRTAAEVARKNMVKQDAHARALKKILQLNEVRAPREASDVS